MPATRTTTNCRVRRRHLPVTPTPSPPKDRSEVERSVVADRLVDSSVAIISSIWFSPLPASGNATPPCSQSSPSPRLSSSTDLPTPSSPSSSSSSSDDDIFNKHCTAAPQLPLRIFIRESLRRSRTSCSTLQAALLYCVRAQRAVMRARLEAEGRYDDAVRLLLDDEDDEERPRDEDEEETEGCAFDRERGYVLAEAPLAFAAVALSTPLPQESEADPIQGKKGTTTTTTDLLTPPPSSPKREYRKGDAPIRFCLSDDSPSSSSSKTATPGILCGRRMFLASVMVASKFLQDHNYSYHAWARISGLPIPELGAMERCFLRAIGYDLAVSSSKSKGGDAWAEWVVELEIRAAAERARSGEGFVMKQKSVQAMEDEDARRVADEMLDLADSDMEDDGEKEVVDVVASANALALAVSGVGQGRIQGRQKDADDAAAVKPRRLATTDRFLARLSGTTSASSSSSSSLRYSPYSPILAATRTMSHGSNSLGGISYVSPYHFLNQHAMSTFQLPLSSFSS
ncbi:hypothetical protein CF327_g3984 [Tilletia walkeri]|uniref:Cyclin N-terminal domain-containing protein n=1 Tax=Tilletia walkeri TaxID=117179 RepID=A0A8X7T5S4_9BASI|nr:hypothetical protein CF327_g3984 [Tilletia walkeri]KAE8268578.1 hypothetical protein A4X09_0g3766 [Tilletia walkeri]